MRRGDKVRFLAPRGESNVGIDRGLWTVLSIAREGDKATATLARQQSAGSILETTQRTIDDLVVVAEFRDAIYPGLISTGKVERGGDEPFHSVINAENFHALQALLYTHEAKVDAINIDPPDNTGAKDWKYNNDYVEGEDIYRHSKWLAFMERRLKLAKRPELKSMRSSSSLVMPVPDWSLTACSIQIIRPRPQAHTFDGNV